MSAWKRGPTQVLESLVGAPANSLSASQHYPGLKAEACSDAVVAQLQLLHAAILAEGGLLPTAMAIAAECGYLSTLKSVPGRGRACHLRLEAPLVPMPPLAGVAQNSPLPCSLSARPKRRLDCVWPRTLV